MRGYILSVWSILDPIYFLFTRLKYLPCNEMGRNIFRVRLTKYKGKLVILSDGTQINKNDTLLKIHLHNVRLLRELRDVKSEIRKGKIIYDYVLKSLPELHSYIKNHRSSEDIKGIIGISLLNKGCERLGFEIVQISHPFYRKLKWLSFIPIGMLASSSNKGLFKHDPPSYLFMSKDKLADLYQNKKSG